MVPIPLPPLAANRRRGARGTSAADEVLQLVPFSAEGGGGGKPGGGDGGGGGGSGGGDGGGRGANSISPSHDALVQRTFWYSTNTVAAAPATLLIFSPPLRLINPSGRSRLAYRVDCGIARGVAMGHVPPMGDAPLLLSPRARDALEVRLLFSGCSWCEPPLAISLDDLRNPKMAPRRIPVSAWDAEGQQVSLQVRSAPGDPLGIRTVGSSWDPPRWVLLGSTPWGPLGIHPGIRRGILLGSAVGSSWDRF